METRRSEPVESGFKVAFRPGMVGDEGAPWDVPGTVDRVDFARYAGSSGSFHPIHHDDEYAHAAGYPAVFGPGMFAAGVLSRYVTDWFGHSAILKFGVRFRMHLFPGDSLTCTGKVVRVDESLFPTADVVVVASNQKGEPVVEGTATARLHS